MQLYNTTLPLRESQQSHLANQCRMCVSSTTRRRSPTQDPQTTQQSAIFLGNQLSLSHRRNQADILFLPRVLKALYQRDAQTRPITAVCDRSVTTQGRAIGNCTLAQPDTPATMHARRCSTPWSMLGTLTQGLGQM